MKKIFFTAGLVLFIAINSFSQAAEKTDYLQRSKNQRITAWVLFGIGAVVNIIGVAKVESPDNTAVTCWIVGSTIMLASIPFSIMAHKNKKRAMSVSINAQQLRQLNSYNLHTVYYPSLTMKIRL